MKLLILFITSVLLFTGCSDEDQTNQENLAPKQEVQTEQMAQNSVENFKQQVQEKIQVDSKEVEAKVDALKDSMTRLKDKVVAVVPNDIDEVEIYNGRCAGCHGHNAEKKALGKSAVVQGWSAEKIASVLHGYKNKTYGRELKAMMQSQASKLSDAEIEALSKYISNL